MESHIEAIQNFLEPKSITDMRSFMAMCKQVSYAAKIKEELLPFRDQLKKDSKNFFGTLNACLYSSKYVKE